MCALAAAVVAPVVAPAPADAAVVICQRKNRLKLRVDACKAKETPVPATELGVVGPMAVARINADGTLSSSNAAPGISVASADAGVGVTSLTLSGTGAFAGMTGANVIINTGTQTDAWQVSNAQVGSITDDELVIEIFSWKSDDLTDLDDVLFVTVFRGN
ncbi:MAG TPA: hypothetical protein VF044_05020 [Actinomycetota bacterium]